MQNCRLDMLGVEHVRHVKLTAYAGPVHIVYLNSENEVSMHYVLLEATNLIFVTVFGLVS